MENQSKFLPFTLYSICFFSGAIIMIMEIASNKFLAPYFGNSIYTWTALIGVVLVSISLGGFFGGWQADKSKNPPFLLINILIAGSSFSALSPFINKYLTRKNVNFNEDIDILYNNIISGPILFSILIIAIPVFLLGMVSPIAIKIVTEKNTDKIGSIAGKISMAGALGSFIGVFLCGFYLIPNYNVRTIFFISTIVLVVLALWLAILFIKERNIKKKAELHVLIILAFVIPTICILANYLFKDKKDSSIIAHKSTFYHEIYVEEQKLDNNIKFRALKLDTTYEGGKFINAPNPEKLPFTYQNYWRVPTFFFKEIKNALFIGGGAFAMPQLLSKKYPNAKIDVVEIDPKVIEIGNQYFDLTKYPNITSHPMDARMFLRKSKKKYDFIFGDAYHGVKNIPAHLVTREFFTKIKQNLSKNGIFLMNTISAVRGKKATLFYSLVNTLKTQFKFVNTFSVSPSNLSNSQNLIFFASEKNYINIIKNMSPKQKGFSFLRKKIISPFNYSENLSKGYLLSDLNNPVEKIIAKQLLNEKKTATK